MSSASRRADFFALEATEYLSELAPLVSARERPDAERLVRGARALRGAALMAGLGTYARAAAGLEAIARQVRDHALPWEPHARDAWTEGLDALRTLVAHATNWEAADDRQALNLAEHFEQVMHGRPVRSPVTAPSSLTPGVRAFIARESALIAGSLEQASRALAPVPPASALAAVLERMQSLRGLGASAELSPLPELLDAMEVATRTLLSDLPAPPNVSAVFADAARALGAMARAVADAGQLIAPPELDSIAQRLLTSYATQTDVIAIATLAPDGVESIAQLGTPPAELPEVDPVPVELVSVGDHLLAVADALTRPASAAARNLRLFVLHRTLSAMPARSGTGRFLAPLTDAITTAIGEQVASQRPDAFVAMLRGCGSFLVDAGGMHDRTALIHRRDAIATSLIMVGAGAPAGGFDLTAPAEAPRRVTPPAPEQPSPPAAAVPPDVVPIEWLAPDDAEADVVDIASLAPDDTADIVDIASLAPDDDQADVIPIEALAPDPLPTIPDTAPGQPTRLERALAGSRARHDGDGSLPSLSGLIAAEIVPVTSLLYRGDAALSRAEEVRIEIRAILYGPAASLDALRPHIDELLDLVPLARDAA